MPIMLPLISCICVTKNRPGRLKRAIALFDSQTYPEKELVVVCDADDVESQHIVATAPTEAKLVLGAPSLSLGTLRNLGISRARGEFFCQWDDDDWYHQDRLSQQLAALRENSQEACVLTNWIIFDESSSRSYFSAFRFWEGSIMCRRGIMTDQLQYPDCSLGEDTLFVGSLIERVGVYPLVRPGLYIYSIHGTNSWSSHAKHFEQIKSRSQFLGPSVSRKIEAIVTGKLTVSEGSSYLQSPELLSSLRYSYFDNLAVAPCDVESYLAGS